MKHPLYKYTFNEIKHGLQIEIDKGNVVCKQLGPLSLYTYTQQCVMDKAWNDFSRAARGLILSDSAIVALVMEKFFNYGEMTTEIPSEPFRIYDKIDGSLIIAYFYNGKWRTVTKGSFNSEQALAAAEHLEKFPIPDCVPKNWTLLFEWVAPENRIVVDYGGERSLYIIGAYNRDNFESVSVGTLEEYFIDQTDENPYRYLILGYSNVYCYEYSFEELKQICETKSHKEMGEGFVLYWPHNDFRIKMKLDDYCTVHRLISRITPLGVWELLMSDIDIPTVKKTIPEEFHKDFDAINEIFSVRWLTFLNSLLQIWNKVEDISDQKEFAITIKKFSPEYHSALFTFRKYSGQEFNTVLSLVKRQYLKSIRPTGNILPGWEPTSSMNRFAANAAGENQ